MVTFGVVTCPNCGGGLKHYDSVNRYVRGRRGIKKQVKIRRLRCIKCGKIHRELPELVVPYKQYDAEIIKGVKEGYITPEVIGYEDYPCEVTMDRWKRAK